jgi:MoxR-like ATPase
LLYIRIGYPTAEEERSILENTTGRRNYQINKVIEGTNILEAQRLVREVHINADLVDSVSRLVRATRPGDSELDFVKDWVRWGAGPRAGQAMILTAKARALLRGNFSVTPDDIQKVAYPVLRHRILMNFKAEAEGVTPDNITAKLLEAITPKSNRI